MPARPRGDFIKIDGKQYSLAVDENKIPAWQMTGMAPTQDGDPLRSRWSRLNDWSRGLGESRGFLDGAVEYAENAYLGGLGRILPGPAITQIATNHSANVKAFCDVPASSRVLSGGGTTVKEISTSQTVVTTGNVSGAVSSMALFIDQVAIAVGNSTDFWRRTSAGNYIQNTDSMKANAFGISGATLMRGRGAYFSRCENSAFQTASNWSAELSMGDLARNIHQVFTHARFDYILKAEGLYAFEEQQVEEQNVLEDLRRWASDENRSVGIWDQNIFVPSIAGLYRYTNGMARTVGVEVAQMNESELANAYPTAFIAAGPWGYVAYYDGTSTWICMVRRAQDGDASLGSPYTITSVIDKFTGKCEAMHISSFTSPPTLYFGAGGNVRWFTLSRDGRPVAYNTGTVTIRFTPSDLGSPLTQKFFRSIEMVGRNIAGGRSVTWAASMDGGSFNNVGSAITSLSSGYAQQFWTEGSNDSGRTIQLRATINNTGGGTTPAEIRDVQINYEERPTMVPAYAATIRAVDYADAAGYSSRATGLAVRKALSALVNGGVVDIVDPWGETFTGRIMNVQTAVNQQFAEQNPMENVTVMIRRLDYA